MRVVISFGEGKGWVIKTESSMGVAVGGTFYQETKDEALKAAQSLHPGMPIEVD